MFVVAVAGGDNSKSKTTAFGNSQDNNSNSTDSTITLLRSTQSHQQSPHKHNKQPISEAIATLLFDSNQSRTQASSPSPLTYTLQ